MKLLRSDIDPLCPVVSLSFAEEQERTYLKMEKETAASKNNNEYKSSVSLAAKVTTNLKSDNVRGLAPHPAPHVRHLLSHAHEDRERCTGSRNPTLPLQSR